MPRPRERVLHDRALRSDEDPDRLGAERIGRRGVAVHRALDEGLDAFGALDPGPHSDRFADRGQGAVGDGQGAGEAADVRDGADATEQLVEDQRDDTTVDGAGWAVVGGVEDVLGIQLLRAPLELDDVEADWRGDRIARADDRAVGEELGGRQMERGAAVQGDDRDVERCLRVGTRMVMRREQRGESRDLALDSEQVLARGLRLAQMRDQLADLRESAFGSGRVSLMPALGPSSRSRAGTSARHCP